MAMWPLFSPAPSARYWAAVVPALVTLRFAAVGAGLVADRKLVAGVAVRGLCWVWRGGGGGGGG
jgi:hypothetical protein